MTKQVKNLKHLQSEIDSALSLINNKGKSLDNIGVPKSDLIAGTQSLLERCEDVVRKKKSKKPIIRVIHHLACSGGTLVSKCIASLPNVFLLSELHPASKLHLGQGKPKFLPADVITQSRYANVPEIDALAWKIFIENIKIAEQHISKFGGHSVIREHTHTDFCVGESFPTHSSVVEHLASEFDVLRVVTLRNPIDSYLSLLSNNWEHFEPKGFNEYCRRVNTFVNDYDKKRVIRYEDFVANPKDSVAKMAKILDLPFSDSFLDTFDIFKLTGDSGRGGGTIGMRERRKPPKQLLEEIASSKYYKKIAERFNY